MNSDISEVVSEKIVIRRSFGDSSKYLRENLKNVLPRALLDVCLARPADPIEYLAKCLYKAADTDLYFQDKAAFEKEKRDVELKVKIEDINRQKAIERYKRHLSELKVILQRQESEHKISVTTTSKRTMRHRSPGTQLAQLGAKRRGTRGVLTFANTTAFQSSEVSYASTTSVVSSAVSSTVIPSPEKPGSPKKRQSVARKGPKSSPGDRSVVTTQRESPSTSRTTPDGLERSPSTSSKISRLITLTHEGEEELRELVRSLSQQIEADTKSKKSKKVRIRTQQYRTSKEASKAGSKESLVAKPISIITVSEASSSSDDQSPRSGVSTPTIRATTPSHKRKIEAAKTKTKKTKAGSLKSFPRPGYQPKTSQGSRESSRESLAREPDEIDKIDISGSFEELSTKESKRRPRPKQASEESERLFNIYSKEFFDQHVPLGGADETKRRSIKREVLTVIGERRSSGKISPDIAKLSLISISTSYASTDFSGSTSDLEEIADEYDKRQQMVTEDIDSKLTIPTVKLASNEVQDQVVEEETPSTSKKSSKSKGRRRKSAGESQVPIPNYIEAKSTHEAEELEHRSLQHRVEKRHKKKVKKRVKKHTDEAETELLDDKSSTTIVLDADVAQFAVADEVDLESQEEEQYDLPVVSKQKKVRRLSASIVDITSDEDVQLVSVVRKQERKRPSIKSAAGMRTDKERQKIVSVPRKLEKQKYSIASTSYEEVVASESEDLISDISKRSPSVDIIELTEAKKRGRRRTKKPELKYTEEDGSQEDQGKTSHSLLLMLRGQEGSLLDFASKPGASTKTPSKKTKPASHKLRRKSSSASRRSSITEPGTSKASEILDRSSYLLDSTLLPSSLDLQGADSSTAPQTTEVTYSCPFTPVQCEWFLADSHTLVCHHPVLGDIRSRPRVSARNFIGWPDRLNYNWRAFYDSEVYTVIDPLPFSDLHMIRKPRL